MKISLTLRTLAKRVLSASDILFSGQAGGPAMIQVIPVDLFAGFTRFHTAGISINNATHTGVCVPGAERMPGNDIWSFMREHPELRVPARW